MITHLTLNTGSTTPFDAARCHKGRVKTIRQLYPKGGLLPKPWDDLRVDFGVGNGYASFCIWRADIPIILNAICWSEKHSADTFAAIEAQYLSLSESNPEVMASLGTASHIGPPATPWLATLIMPTILGALPIHILQERLSTIAQLEQATAAALIPHEP